MALLEGLIWVGNHLGLIVEVVVGVVGVASIIVRLTPTTADDKFLAPIVRFVEALSLARKKPAVVGKGAKADQVDAVVDALELGDAGELQAMLEAVQSYRAQTEPEQAGNRAR